MIVFILDIKPIHIGPKSPKKSGIPILSIFKKRDRGRETAKGNRGREKKAKKFTKMK